MKLMKMLMIMGVSLISVVGLASVKVPADLTKLAGAYEGKTVGSRKKVKALIVPKAQKPGTFLIALLIGDPQGILFDGELISGSQNIGLSSLGLSQDSSEIEVTVPPAALMQIVYKNAGEAERIEINPQSGSGVLSEAVILDSQDESVSLSAPQPGQYGSVPNQVTVGPDGFVKAQLSSLRLNGQFTSTLDISNLGVLRGVSFDANYQSHESDQVSGIMMTITDGRRQSLIVGAPNPNGGPVSVLMLKKK